MFAGNNSEVYITTSNNSSTTFKLNDQGNNISTSLTNPITVEKSTDKIFLFTQNKNCQSKTELRSGLEPTFWINIISPLWIGFFIDYFGTGKGKKYQDTVINCS